MGELIGAREAASRLRISVSSLYAYVSRGALRRVPGPDGRTSLYDTDEVDALATRSRPRTKKRAAASIDLLVASAVSTVTDGVVRYRGVEVAELVNQRLSFESVAGLLWRAPEFQADAEWSLPALASRELDTSGGASSIVPQLIEAINRTQTDVHRVEQAADFTASGQRAIAAMLSLNGVQDRDRRDVRGNRVTAVSPYRVASRLWAQWSPLSLTPARVRAVNTALVLLAEHELALSTISARVAASARARPEMCVVAGLAALDGTLHGRASTILHSRLQAVRGVPRAGEESQVGSGHVIHRADPRTSILLDAVWPIASVNDRRRIELFARELGPAVNVDLALAALAFVARMPLGSTTAIFAIARTAGWIAHAQEEYDEQPLRFRGHAMRKASTQVSRSDADYLDLSRKACSSD
ncbi:MAG: citrate/2-methylcitrate synthase [Dermabacter sp.]|nr:citrate/2-methylcitrate synthase [Dermabacter sp.]